MRGLLTVIGGVLVIVLESVGLELFGVEVWGPQLAVVLVVYVAGRRPFGQAALATLLFSGVADVCWGGSRGHYALGLTVVFFVVYALRLRVGRLGGLALALLALPAVVVTDLVALTTLALFQRGASPLGALLSVTPLMALWTTLFALPLVWLLSRIDRLIEQRKAASLQ